MHGMRGRHGGRDRALDPLFERLGLHAGQVIDVEGAPPPHLNPRIVDEVRRSAPSIANLGMFRGAGRDGPLVGLLRLVTC